MKCYYKCPKCGTTKDHHCSNCGNKDFEKNGLMLKCTFCDENNIRSVDCNK